MSGPPLVRRRVVVTVSVTYLTGLGVAMPWNKMCTLSCGVTAGVLVGVAVGVRVAGHGSGREVLPLALIIQLPGSPNESIVPTVSLVGSPRLATLGAAPLPLPTTHERTCEGGLASSAAGNILGWNEPDSAQKSSKPMYRSSP